MRKLSILFGLVLVLGMTIPAMADVFVYGDIYKEKDIYVYEEVNIYKNIYIDVTVDVDLVKAAEADSLVNQLSDSNVVVGVEGIDPEKPVADKNFRTAIIADSINGNIGIVGVNQDAGNFNNQANVVSIAVAIEEAAVLPAFANAQASAQQTNIFNYVEAEEFLGPLPGQKYDLINGSINGNIGIVGVNQSVGNMNNQLNQVALAVADNAWVALAEADLGQFNAFNWVREVGTVKSDTITGSINGNIGIVGVNQSAGNMNNQANVVSIAATIPR